jgi:hypothetical protein
VLPVHAAFACTPTKIGVIYLTRGHSLDSAQLSVLRVLNRRSAGQSRLPHQQGGEAEPETGHPKWGPRDPGVRACRQASKQSWFANGHRVRVRAPGGRRRGPGPGAGGAPPPAAAGPGPSCFVPLKERLGVKGPGLRSFLLMCYPLPRKQRRGRDLSGLQVRWGELCL